MLIENCRQLKSVRVGGGEIRRRLLTVGGQPIVLMTKTHPVLRPCFNREEWRSFANWSTLPHSLNRELETINRNLRFSFNCHAMSIGALLGMKLDEWLEGTSGVFTCMSNPAQDLLDTHFRKIGSVAKVNELPEMRHNDVLVFRDSRTGDLVHSGRIRILDSERLLLSKLGEHAAAITSIQATADKYQRQYDCLDVFRIDHRDNSH